MPRPERTSTSGRREAEAGLTGQRQCEETTAAGTAAVRIIDREVEQLSHEATARLPGVSGIEASYFEVDERLSAVTRGRSPRSSRSLSIDTVTEGIEEQTRSFTPST